MDIKELSEKYQESLELQEYCDAQAKTIIEISKKLKALQDENLHLKQMLESSVPLIQTKDNLPSLVAKNDEEAVARQQLFRLKQISQNRELTLEEARRVEIFAKILNTLKSQPKTFESQATDVPLEELLKIAQYGPDDRR